VKGEWDELKCKVAQLTEQVDRVGEVPPQPIAHDTSVSIKVVSDKGEESSTEDWSSSKDHSVASSATRKSLPKGSQQEQPAPPGFKEVCGRVQPFSGKQGDNDFQMWLDDF